MPFAPHPLQMLHRYYGTTVTDVNKCYEFHLTSVLTVERHTITGFPRSNNLSIILYLDASYKPATLNAPVTHYGLS